MSLDTGVFVVLYIYYMVKKNEKTKPTEEIIEVDGREYVLPTQMVLDAANLMTKAWVDLGKPDSIFTQTGRKLMVILIGLWQDMMPEEAREWMIQRKKYQDNELSASEQIRKQTGRSLVSLPRFIYSMMRALFKDEKQDTPYWKKLAKEYPMFRFTNKV